MARTALITGANRGIGQQLAKELATDGWDVLMGCRDKRKGDAAAARLRKGTGGRLRAIELDVASDASVTTAAQKLRDGAIRLDALVNNAGVYREAGVLEINFFGALRTIDAMRPLLVDTASITNVTSDLASGSRAGLATTRDALIAQVRAHRDDYSFSKAALDQLTIILAKELAPIRVNSTSPGWVRSDMGGRGAPRSLEQGAASLRHGIDTKDTGTITRDGKKLA